LPRGTATHPADAVRTSAVDSLTAVRRPRLSAGGVAVVSVPPESVTTYTFTS
jgi:hypothetical protein